MKRIQAYTIVEILITLTISSFVILIVMQVFQIMEKQFYQYKGYNEQITNVLFFNDVLQTDINNSDVLTVSSTQLNLKTLAGKEMSYNFLEKCCIRNTTVRSDTFFYRTISFINYFQDKATSNGIVDEIHLKILENTDTLNMAFQKSYASDVLIENTK